MQKDEFVLYICHTRMFILDESSKPQMTFKYKTFSHVGSVALGMVRSVRRDSTWKYLNNYYINCNEIFYTVIQVNLLQT